MRLILAPEPNIEDKNTFDRVRPKLYWLDFMYIEPRADIVHGTAKGHSDRRLDMYGISSQRHITLLLAVGRECASSPLFSGKACLSAVSAIAITDDQRTLRLFRTCVHQLTPTKTGSLAARCRGWGIRASLQRFGGENATVRSKL